MSFTLKSAAINNNECCQDDKKTKIGVSSKNLRIDDICACVTFEQATRRQNEEAVENAMFIVLPCNAHYDLVKALGTFRNCVDEDVLAEYVDKALAIAL